MKKVVQLNIQNSKGNTVTDLK